MYKENRARFLEPLETFVGHSYMYQFLEAITLASFASSHQHSHVIDQIYICVNILSLNGDPFRT